METTDIQEINMKAAEALNELMEYAFCGKKPNTEEKDIPPVEEISKEDRSNNMTLKTGSIINVGVTPLRCHFQHYFFAKK